MNRALINTLQNTVPRVTVIMASKSLEPAALMPYYAAGIKHFGENRVDAFLEKKAALEIDVTWHFIGTLQSKKVKKVIHDIDVLHTLDREKIIAAVQHERRTPLDAFIQFNISHEPNKHGFDLKAIPTVINALKNAPIIHPIGVMGMAQNSSDLALIERQFKTLVEARNTLQRTFPSIQGLSMGMSDDYKIALKLGATHLRLGRILLEDSHAI